MLTVSIELQKAFGNTKFLIALAFGCLLALISAVGNIAVYQNTLDQIIEWWDVVALDLSASSCFRFFMTSDYIQPTTDLFYALIPLLAAMPYGWSLCEEKNKGYLQNVYIRSKRKQYLAAKAFAAASSGFVVIAIPLVLNLLLCACFIPAYPTDISSVFTTGIYDSLMLVELYYSAPIAYVCFLVVLTGVFGAAWALLVLVIGGYAHDSVRLIAGLFVLLYMFGALDYKLGVFIAGSGTEFTILSPLIWLRGVVITGQTSLMVAGAWVCALLIISLLFASHFRKEDVL